jgi:uncharacterized membrane protein YeaQ/YmgE (transglycosylase-associated protein family)
MNTDQIVQIVVILAFGLVVGWIASLVVGGGGGPLKYIIWGLLGAVVGGILVPALGIPIELGHPLVNAIVTATIGAVVLVLVARLIG